MAAAGLPLATVKPHPKIICSPGPHMMLQSFNRAPSFEQDASPIQMGPVPLPKIPSGSR